jgi:hypothetical protein
MSKNVWKKTNPILEFGIGVIIASCLAIALQQFGILDLIYDIGFTKAVTVNKTNK